MDILNLLNDEELHKYISAIENKKNYTYDSDGLKIWARFDDGFESQYFEYNKPLTEQEKFTEFLETLDDEMFTAVSERLDVNKISEMLASTDDNTVKEAIAIFKDELKQYAQEQVDYYSQYID